MKAPKTALRERRIRAAYKGQITRLKKKHADSEELAAKLDSAEQEIGRLKWIVEEVKQVIKNKLCVGNVVLTEEEARQLQTLERTLHRQKIGGLYV